MLAKHKKILDIAHKYTQNRLENGWNPTGKVFWNYSEMLEKNDSISAVFSRTETEGVIVVNDSGESVWKSHDLIFGNAVREAKFFVYMHPELSVEECCESMLSSSSHGYGYLIEDHQVA